MKLLIWLFTCLIWLNRQKKKSALGSPEPQLIKWFTLCTSAFSARGISNYLSSWVVSSLRKNLIPLALLALLTGCAISPRTLTPSSANTPGTAPVSASYQGRFAVSYKDEQGRTQNVYGHFVWRESGTTLTLQLLNPLGQTLALLQVTPSDATLRLPNRPPQTATHIEDLMQQVLGFALPVSNLRTWLRPIEPIYATPSSSSAQANPNTLRTLRKTGCHPAQIKQDGWTINYIDATDKQGTTPRAKVRRINLSRDAPPTQIKLVIDL